MASAPANWYPDPEDPRLLRYWDGLRWTDHRAPNRQYQAPQPANQPVAQPPIVAVPPASTPEDVGDRGGQKIPFFRARGHAQDLAEEVEHLRSELARLGMWDVVQLEQERTRLHAEIGALRAQFQTEQAQAQQILADLRQRVVRTQDEEILQEAGLYAYRHPLQDSIAYKQELERLRDQIRAMVRKDGGAIEAATAWNVNGSAAEGRKMIRDFSKLMLRAYNAEADNLVRGMKPYRLAAAVERLDKVATTIQQLGRTMSIRVAVPYHRLRVRELEMAADYQEMLAREKEAERAERERLREERKVQQEIERERERLDKERQHYLNALAALETNGDAEGAARMRAQLGDIDKALADVDYRAANIKAGYVYVISNVGAFGERMIKVGLTRRLEPMDRIRELGDASVPFNFDVHALFFSENAVDIEAQMHRSLADRRVNQVNLRREFFYATPAEARDLLTRLTGELLHFEELPEAIEYHQSQQPSRSDTRATDPTPNPTPSLA